MNTSDVQKLACGCFTIQLSSDREMTSKALVNEVLSILSETLLTHRVKGAHTDVECFTIVTQDNAGGLEVLSKQGRWIKAPPVPGSFVVNIADCFMRQTNDFFVSTIHRVINESGKERYSAPFFFGFDRKMVLDSIPTCVSEENPMKYPVITAGEYCAWRTNVHKSTGRK